LLGTSKGKIMRKNRSSQPISVVLFALFAIAGLIAPLRAYGSDAAAANTTPGSPALRQQGTATQLVVDGKPFLMLAGEVNNSSSSSLTYMQTIWTHMNNLHANTVLVPVSWEEIEPAEGTYDFSIPDGLIRGARAHNLHLVFLWLASWKNGMSSYQPLWVKKDYQRFPSARAKDGSPREVLSTLSSNNWTADATAFAALMAHVRDFDRHDHTLLMVQVENEVGILGDSRDRSAEANAAYDGPVPADLLAHLVANDQNLVPELQTIWTNAGHLTSGTWEQVFGVGAKTDEIFMAWNYSRYVDHVAAAGKAEYDIPMYANCWLNDPMDSPPGNFPSGCPESDMMDIWQAGASHLNMLGPDLYAGNFEERCQLYTRRGNTLFIPEMNSDGGGAHNVYLAIGKYNAIGTSPFGVDHTSETGPFEQTYSAIGQIAPIFLAHQGLGETAGFVLDSDHPSYTFDMDDYEVDVTFDSVFGRSSSLGYGIVVKTGPDQFIGAGAGFRVGFKPLTPGPKYAGIGEVKQGTFVNGVWVPGEWLNGDETDQGSGWRFSSWQNSVETCTIYRYE
jgi:beta-galactosidase GanA